MAEADDLLKLLDRPIAFQRCFVTLTHSVTAALMLSQALYWSFRTKEDSGWFYKTREEWEEETGLTRREQEGARKNLRRFPFWHEERRDLPAKLHYRIDRATLLECLLNQENASWALSAQQDGTNSTVSCHTSAQQDGTNSSVNQDGTKAPIQLGAFRPTGINECARVSDLGPETTPETTVERPAPKKAKKPKTHISPRSRRAPQDFVITDTLHTWAHDHVPDVNLTQQTAMWLDYEYKDPKSDWGAAWKNWMRRAAEMQPRTRAQRAALLSKAEARTQRYRLLIASAMANGEPINPAWEEALRDDRAC